MALIDPFADRLTRRWYTGFVFAASLMAGLLVLGEVAEILARSMPADDAAFGSVAGLSTGAYYLFAVLLFGIPNAALIPRRGVRWLGFIGLGALLPFVLGIGSFIFRPGHWDVQTEDGALAASAFLQVLVLFSGGFAAMSALTFLGWRRSLMLRLVTVAAVVGFFPAIFLRIGYPTQLAPTIMELVLISVTVVVGIIIRVQSWRSRHRTAGQSSVLEIEDLSSLYGLSPVEPGNGTSH